MRIVNAETWLIGRLTDTVGVPVKSLVDAKTRYVRVFRSGGAKHSRVTDTATLTIDVYGKDWLDAAELAGKTAGIVEDSTGATRDGTVCVLVEHSGGPARMPDPETGRACYRLTYHITFRNKES